MSDVTVNVTNAGAAGVTVTNGSTVNATVGNGGSVSVATGTISPGNATVVSGTVNVGKVTTLSSGSSASATNSGTSYNAVIDFGIPAGPATTVTVGSTTTLSAGSNATVTGTTSGSTVSLAFGIPAGKAGSDGATPSISIGTVTTGAAGSSASVKANTVSGGVSFDFTIPAGATGATGSTSYTLPAASSTVLGGVKQGSNVTIASDGTLSVAAPVTSLAASAITGLSAVATTGSASDLSAGTIASARLPAATTSAAGAVIVGTGLAISSGVLSATATGGGVGANDTVDGGDYVGVVASLSFTTQPSDVSISINQGSTGSASFTAAAAATTGVAVSYQWQANTGSAWAAIDGATSGTLSLTGLTGANDGTLYRCLATAYGVPTVASNSASLDVSVIVPSAPVISISAQPQPSSIANTSNTTSFSITASVTTGTLAYQWQKRESGATTWANVSGATGSTLSLSGLDYVADNQDAYRCRLSASGAASLTSSTATLTITWATAPQITIINGPSTINWPAQLNFATVTYDERIYGNATVTRQWQAQSGSSWVDVASLFSAWNAPITTNSSLTFYNINRVLTVRCVITAVNSYGTTTATTGSVTVNPPSQA